MICSELKGIRKGLEKLAKEICLNRISKDCGIKILEEENGNPIAVELYGKCFELKLVDNPPQASNAEKI